MHIQNEREEEQKEAPTTFSAAAVETRLRRQAQRAASAAVVHVKQHRRRESLAEKLLLEPDELEVKDEDNISELEADNQQFQSQYYGPPQPEQSQHRRDSSSPIVDLGFDDPDVLYHYEKLKVKDLERELKSSNDKIKGLEKRIKEYKQQIDALNTVQDI